MVANAMLRKINKLEKLLAHKRKENRVLQEKVEHLEKYLSYYQKKSLGAELIENCKLDYQSEEQKEKIALLEKTIGELNYRDYITRTKNGVIVIDIEQFLI